MQKLEAEAFAIYTLPFYPSSVSHEISFSFFLLTPPQTTPTILPLPVLHGSDSHPAICIANRSFMGRDHRPNSSKACVSLLCLIFLTPLSMPIIFQVLRMKAASLPTEFLLLQLPQSKTTRPNFLDHRTPTIIIIDRMFLLPPIHHDQAVSPGPVCRVRALRSLTIAQRHPPVRVHHLNAREPYPSPNLWSLTSPPLHVRMYP